MYPPPEKNVLSEVRFELTDVLPPPTTRMKSWISGQCDILVLATNINQNVKKIPLSH